MVTNYTYNEINQLVQAGNTTYTYDANSNRTSMTKDGVVTTYSYNSLNQIIRAGDVNYTWDNAGNLVSQSSQGVTVATYTYDSRNRMISANVNSLQGTITESYTYDYLGNRTSKTSGGVTTVFTTDLSTGYSQVLKATKRTDTVYYTRGFELISRREGTNASYYLYDGGLSVRALTDEDGDITDTLVFDAFGNETGMTGTTDNSYGFQGEEQDATGLYYLRARYMDPSTGTFTSMDTYSGSLSDPVSLHKYLFANANPVMYSDPSGHAPFTLEGFAVAIGMSAIIGAAFSSLDYAICALITDPEFENHDLIGLAKAVIRGWALGVLTGIGFYIFGLIPGLTLTFWAVVGLAIGICSGVNSIACGFIDKKYVNSEQGTYEITMGVITLIISAATFGLASRAINTPGRGYEGDLYRSSKYDPLEINRYNVKSNHRYTETGIGGLYFGTDEGTVNAELTHYHTNPNEAGRKTFLFHGELENMLDLTNPDVLRNLGVDYNSITSDDYSVTHIIGRFALSNGYEGIIAPSARDVGGINVITFGNGGIS